MAAPASRSQRRRAERRHPRPVPPPASRAAGVDLSWLVSRRPRVQALTALWMLATLVLLGLTALSIERKITWYLAVDQYGYLSFAHDLMRGRIFHHWPPLDALAVELPARVDALVQTYVYDRGLLYCRYAPGFPLLLAGWLTLFGDDAAHYLNPTIFLALLGLVLAFQMRVFRSGWRATAGVALVVLFPTMMHLWALTLVRDLSSHLAGLLGLFLLLPVRGRPLGARHAAAAGLALGYAGSIRPDALLYLPSALLIAVTRWRRQRMWPRGVLGPLAAGAGGVALGLVPFLAYNWAATGHPFRATQGMEVQNFLPGSAPPIMTPPVLPPATPPGVGFPPGAWKSGTVYAVQGGGLRLANLPRVLPGNLGLLRHAYGDILFGVALWGVMVAFVRRRLLFHAAVPYAILALLFYSCWTRPDGRYLSGVYLFMPMLIVEGVFGTLDLVRRLSRSAGPAPAQGLAFGFVAALLIGSMLIDLPGGRSALPFLTIFVPTAAGAAALAAATWPRRRIAAVVAPIVALVLVTVASSRAADGLDARATFQRPEMLRARATFARAVEPGAVVITTEDVGRPGENIDYYSGVARALYLTDLARWRMSVPRAAELLARAGMKPYLLIPTSQPDRGEMLQALAKHFQVELAADIPPGHAMDYFVAASFYPRGVHMELYRLVERSLAPTAP